MEIRKESIEHHAAAAADQAAEEREYWLTKLSGDLVKSSFIETFAGSGNNIKPGVRTREMAAAAFDLPAEAVSRLVWISNESDARLHMILSACFILLLYKYTGNRDIIVGTPIYKQDKEGEFINTVLILRHIVDETASFKELIMQVKQAILEAVEYQNYPLKTLLYELDIAYSEDDFPLFDSVILLKNIQDKAYIEYLKPNIYFSFSKEGEGIAGLVEYDATLFGRERVERIIEHSRNLLTRALHDPECSLAGIDMLSPEERHSLIHELNDTAVKQGYEYPGPPTVQRLFEDQVEKSDDHIAMVMQEHSLTYRALNEKANRWARRLRDSGVKPGTLVGILSERSLDTAYFILSILKAGGAYVPIDPSLPAGRIRTILADSNLKLVLHQDKLKKKMDEAAGNLKLDLKPASALETRANKEAGLSNPPSVNTAADIVYIIYTSGSTGIPKAAVLEHRSVSNMLMSRKEMYRMEPRHAALQFFPYSFDGFVTSFFTPLIAGAKTVFLSEEEIRDIPQVSEIIVKHKVTHFICIPQLYYQVIAGLTAGEAQTLKVVTLAGDRLHPDVIAATKQKNKRIEIVNEYGVTEAAVMSTILRHQEKTEGITIGKPVWNTAVYIMNKQNTLQGKGIKGNLCISGTGVARGYLNKSQLTHDKFTADPFKQGERLYHTGDIAGWLPDGCLEFLGRSDHQVKIRGFRIELGEIEARLRQHPLVREAVALIRERDDTDRHICVYITADDRLSEGELRDYAAGILPAYMLPSYYVKMGKIPLTAAGKIDRKALPQAVVNREPAYTAPRKNVEKRLARLWSEILDVDYETIGLEANFFELGGHSLKTTMLINRVEKEFGARVPAAKVFTSPTIAGLARCIEGAENAFFSSIEPGEKKEYYPLSSAQKRMFILQQMDAANVTYNISGYLVIRGNIDPDRLEEVFSELIETHESLRTSFHIVAEEPVQKVSYGSGTGYRIERSALAAGDSPPTLRDAGKITSDYTRPFDLAKAPLLRVVLIDSGASSHILFVDIHHITADGLSLKNLMEEFLSIYNGEELPSLKLQYRDYAGWESRNEYKEQINSREEFWLNEFREKAPPLELPIDYERPHLLSFAGDTVGFDLDEGSSLELDKIAAGIGATSFMIILALYDVFLGRLCRRDDIVVGVPVSGRTDADLDRVIGMFVNTLVMRNYPAGHKTFLEFLHEVKEKTIQATGNQEYPYDSLVEKIEPERDPGRNPLFDVMLEYGDIELPVFDIPGLSIQIHETPLQRSKFDLNLRVMEKDNRYIFKFEYSTGLFKKETIEWMIERFFVLVESVIQDPACKIDDLRFKTKEEERLDEVEDVKFAF